MRPINEPPTDLWFDSKPGCPASERILAFLDAGRNIYVGSDLHAALRRELEARATKEQP